MPLYNYTCKKCGKKETAFEKVENRDNHYCSECHELMERQAVPDIAGIRFIGLDFYQTRNLNTMLTPEPVQKGIEYSDKDVDEVAEAVQDDS